MEDKAQTVRNKYFETAQNVAQESASSGGPLMGTLFWHWYDEGMGPGQYGGACRGGAVCACAARA